MELDSFIDITFTSSVELTVREIFAAVRDEMLCHFDGFPTKKEAKDWLIYDANDDAILSSILYTLEGDIIDTNILNFIDKHFDEYYEYAKNTNV